jgi:hypothetical protein
MKFNLFLLTIVLLGSIPCFYAAQRKGIKRRGRKGGKAAALKFWRRTYLCSQQGMKKIQDEAITLYDNYVGKMDSGKYYRIGTVEDCNEDNARTCSCNPNRLKFNKPGEDENGVLKDLNITDEDIKTGVVSGTSNAIIVLKKFDAEAPSNCRYLLLKQNSENKYFKMQMKCPKNPKFVNPINGNGKIHVATEAIQRNAQPIQFNAQDTIQDNAQETIQDNASPRRRLLHQGDCDT